MGKNGTKKESLPLCQAIAHLSGYPKHLREWWCFEPTPESLAQAIQLYQYGCAPDKEQHSLQGMLKKIMQVASLPGGWHVGFRSRSHHLLRTPIGILQQVDQYFWHLPDKNNDYDDLSNALEIIKWKPANLRMLSHKNLNAKPMRQHSLELF